MSHREIQYMVHLRLLGTFWPKGINTSEECWGMTLLTQLESQPELPKMQFSNQNRSPAQGNAPRLSHLKWNLPKEEKKTCPPFTGMHMSRGKGGNGDEEEEEEERKKRGKEGDNCISHLGKAQKFWSVLHWNHSGKIKRHEPQICCPISMV